MTSDPTSSPPACPPAAPSPGFTTPAEVDLRELVTAERVLIALDFDGVLAPLQDDPETSRILPESAAAITALSTIPGTRVALVSGRDIATLRRLAAPPEDVWIVGSHGAEVDLGTAARSPELTAAESSMLSAIDDHLDSFAHTLPVEAVEAPSATGFRVERKPYSRTVHTRGFDAAFASALHEHAVAVQQEFPEIRVIEGHDITELAVKQATKGDGLRELMTAEATTAVAYFGDDVTDEDAFAELERLSADHPAAAVLGVKVGPAPTRAPVRIADPDAVAELLARLAKQRLAAQRLSAQRRSADDS
ncbi:MAG: trehalose-phosphatase [Brevibacterium sp.]